MDAKEAVASWLQRVATAFFGGMGGCAMIDQSVINVTSGGRSRLSTFTAGAFLLFLLAVLGPFVGRVPMPALVAVMIMVSIGTFSWNSRRGARHPHGKNGRIPMFLADPAIGREPNRRLLNSLNRFLPSLAELRPSDQFCDDPS